MAPLAASCTTPTGSVWVPNVAAASASNHNTRISIAKTTLSPVTGTLVGHGEAWTSLIPVTIDMSTDLGTGGSLSLIAQTTNFPSNLNGTAFPILVSLNDGTNEYLHFKAPCTSGSGYDDAACDLDTTQPNAYFNFADWQQHQILSTGGSYPSVNVFPNCNWAGGTATDSLHPTCSFNTNFFVGGKLRSGVNYTAKYVLLLSGYTANPNASTASVTVTVIKKSAASTDAGAIDLNVILVGSKNVQASRTSKGQQNLNTLIAGFANLYNPGTSPSPAIKLGNVNVIEWGCDTGGDSYATLSTSGIGTMLSAATSVLPSATEGKAINLFVVSSITDTSTNLTTLGIAGAIGGPMINGTPASGVVMASFNRLDTFNSNCDSSLATCPAAQQDAFFASMIQTAVHETGHFLGLNHPSESAGTVHDSLPDTPVCTKTQSVAGQNFITPTSCSTDATNKYFWNSADSPAAPGLTCSDACPGYSASGTIRLCPTRIECEFNHVMYWTTKSFDSSNGTSDGNMFSPYSSKILNYNPYVQ